MKFRFKFAIFLLLFSLPISCGEEEQDVTKPANETGVNKSPKEITHHKDGQKMVLVPAGAFFMGTDDEKRLEDEHPEHQVYLNAFYIDKFEVTNAAYKKFVDETGHRVPRPVFQGREYPNAWENDTYPEGKANYPVVFVTWSDADAYCKWAGKRLPTEAEWEKAARGIDKRIYPWGNEFDPTLLNSGMHNAKGEPADGFEQLAPVGSFPGGASPYGAMDMQGNVAEWIADWFDEDYYKHSPARNPKGPQMGRYRVIRGTGWGAFHTYHIQCTNRGSSKPPAKRDSLGFRCVMDVKTNRTQDDTP